jgi:hypothetical protein
MNSVKGIYKNGQILLEMPADWPDGTEVIIEPISHDESLGMAEEEQGDDPESIARWIAEFDAIPPLQITPEEEAEWQVARQAQKEFEKATFFDRAEKLRRMWE